GLIVTSNDQLVAVPTTRFVTLTLPSSVLVTAHCTFAPGAGVNELSPSPQAMSPLMKPSTGVSLIVYSTLGSRPSQWTVGASVVAVWVASWLPSPSGSGLIVKSNAQSSLVPSTVLVTSTLPSWVFVTAQSTVAPAAGVKVAPPSAQEMS